MEDEKTPKRYPLRIIPDLNGYSVVWMPGSPSHLIIKSASSPPQIISVAGGEVNSLHSLNTPTCKSGFTYIEDRVSFRSVCQFHECLTTIVDHLHSQAPSKHHVQHWLGHSQNTSLNHSKHPDPSLSQQDLHPQPAYTPTIPPPH